MSESGTLREEAERAMVELRALGDELKVQAHLAGMEASRKWAEEVEPALRDLERRAAEAGHQAEHALADLVSEARRTFADLRGRLRS